jgi:hypothetical protein
MRSQETLAGNFFIKLSSYKVFAYNVQSKSFQNLPTNNIVFYLELNEYYPLQNSVLEQEYTSPTAFSIF